MNYRLYNISSDTKSNDIAIPEDRVEDFDSILSSLPAGYEIEDLLNKFGAVLIG